MLLQKNVANSELNTFKKSVSNVDETYRPIQQYMQTCMYQVSLRGLQQLGQHGGYIDPLGKQPYKSFFFDDQNVLNSDGVALSQEARQSFVPYWFDSTAKVDKDNLQPSINIPTLDDIKLQHQRYVDSQLLSCINNFSQLEFAGVNITLLDVPKTEIVYAPKEVLVKTTLPLSVTDANGKTSNMESYLVTLPVPFQEMYLMATTITQAEAGSQYLENLVSTLISYYGRPDFGALPPTMWKDSSFVKVSWEQTLVNNRLQDLLRTYIPALRVAGTKNQGNFATDSLNEQEKHFYESFDLPIFRDKNNQTIAHPKTEITHLFLNWPMYSKVSPSQGNIILPVTQDNSENFEPKMLPPEPETTYRFFYDVSYPVVVELKQTNLSPDIPDFTFLFALESNMKKNLRWTDYAQGKGPLPWDPSLTKVDLVGSNYPKWNESQTVVNTQGVVQKQFPDISLFTDYQQRLSGNISVETFDAKTNEPLEEVQVSLGAGTYAKSYLGLTQLDDQGLSSFTTQTALVQNGYLSLKKKNYFEYVEPITVNYGESKDLGPKKLYPIITKNVSIKVLDLVAEEHTDPWNVVSELGDIATMQQFHFNEDNKVTVTTYSFVERDLQDDEVVLFTFKRLTDPEKPAQFTQVGIFNGSQEHSEINLVPGRYELNAMLLDMGGVVIPADSKKVCSGLDCLLLSKEDRYIPDEPINITPAMWGGLDFGEDTPWLASDDVVYGDNTLVFYVIKFPKPKDIDSLTLLGQLGSFSMQYRQQLAPQIVGYTNE